MTLDAFLERLRAPSKTPAGWTAFCPGHDDTRTRSLSVRASGDRILLHCFSGCTAERIMDALGLKVSDLFLAARGAAPMPETIVATYDYTDGAGGVLYQVVRYEPKTFRQRRPDGAGGWAWNLQGIQRVPYRLPDLLEQERVVWVEGEKDVETLRAVGIVATTGAQGVASFKAEYRYPQQLVACGVQEVVVLPDNDPPGLAYAEAVVLACRAAARRPAAILLPDLPLKGDVSDWLSAGRSPEELCSTLARADFSAPRLPAGPTEPLSVVLDRLVATLQRGPAPAVRSPFAGLNSLLGGGFRAGEFVFVGAWPGVGKTAFGLEIARSAAADGVATLIISREMTTEALARRLLAQHGRINATRLRQGGHALDDLDWQRIHDTVQQLRDWPVWMTDALVTSEAIAQLVAAWPAAPPLGLVIVDYLQLVQAPEQIRERRLQVEAVSLALKALAMSMKLPVVCMSALSRRDKESSRRPTMADLRESGALEHDADIILMLHREMLSRTAECIVAKNRDGGVGITDLDFTPEHVHFSETPVERV